MLTALEGLAALGPVDLAMLVPAEDDEPATPDWPVARLDLVPLRPQRYRWLPGRGGSGVLAGRDQRALGDHHQRWTGEGYDVAWYDGLTVWAAVGVIAGARAVVDVHDAGEGRGPARRLLEDVDAVAVATEPEREGLLAVHPTVRAGIVPDSCGVPAVPVGRGQVGRPPTLTLAGDLTLPAMVAAAEQLAGPVASLLRVRLPELQVRLVGQADARVERLARPPTVVATGGPEAGGGGGEGTAAELAVADVVALPLSGAGGASATVVEAFAHRVPVVASAAAVEGLDLVHGRHFLLAQRDRDVADACARLLQDEALRRVLADQAQSVFLQRHQRAVVRPLVTDLVRHVTGAG